MCDVVTIKHGPSNGKGATVLASFACGRKMAAFRSGPSSWVIPAATGMAYVQIVRRSGAHKPRVSWGMRSEVNGRGITHVRCLPLDASYADRDDAFRRGLVELHAWMTAADPVSYWQRSFGRPPRLPEPVG